MRACVGATFAAVIVAAWGVPAAGDPSDVRVLTLASESEVALFQPAHPGTDNAELLPAPQSESRPVPRLLPPVDSLGPGCDNAGERDVAGAFRIDVGRGSVADGSGLNAVDSNNTGEKRLTLADVEAMALGYHPAVREATGLVRAARGNWLQVGLRPNPEIGYNGSEIGNEGAAGQQGGFVSKEFVTAGKLGLNRSVASQEVAQAQQRLEVARLQVLTTARINYFEVLAAERTVALSRQLNDVASESVRITELRLKALDIPRVSLLQSQVERESAVLLEQQATERTAAAWRNLAVTIGVNNMQPQALDDILLQPLPELEWELVRERVLAESPELAELRFAISRARWAVQRASAGRVPNLSTSAGVALDNATEDTIANVTVSMPLPMFDRNQGAVVEACGELAAAQAALDERAIALEQQLAVTLRDYTTARQRAMKYSETVLPIARESLDLTSAGYREGELEYVSVLLAQQTFAEKNLGYLRDLETAWKKWAEIDGLLVGTLDGRAE